MSRFRVRVVGVPSRSGTHIDARVLGLRVECDGDRFQFFSLCASGEELDLFHADLAERRGFWSAAAAIAAGHLRDQLDSISPLDDPTQPIELRVDYLAVSHLLANGPALSELVDGSVLLEWCD